MEFGDMPIGVNAILLNKKNQVLLGKRNNSFGEGTFGLIGGKMKYGETIEECIIRELKEEIGVIVLKDDIEIVGLASTNIEIPMIQIGVLIKKYNGAPHIQEPQYCTKLDFFDLDKLPKLFVVSEVIIRLYLENKFYDRKYNI